MAKFLYAAIICIIFSLSSAAAATQPDTDESNAKLSFPLTQAISTETVSAVPLTEVSFRPINRRFAVRSKHPCRHRYRIHPMATEEIRYGNDMIVSSNGESSGFQIHHHDEDDDRRIKRIVFKRYDYGRFDRERTLKVLKKLRKHVRREEEEERKKKKNMGSGFMKRVREFLDNYF